MKKTLLIFGLLLLAVKSYGFYPVPVTLLGYDTVGREVFLSEAVRQVASTSPVDQIQYLNFTSSVGKYFNAPAPNGFASMYYETELFDRSTGMGFICRSHNIEVQRTHYGYKVLDLSLEIISELVVCENN